MYQLTTSTVGVRAVIYEYQVEVLYFDAQVPTYLLYGYGVPLPLLLAHHPQNHACPFLGAVALTSKTNLCMLVERLQTAWISLLA